MSEDLIRRSDAIKVAKEFWYKPDIAGALAELPAIEPKTKVVAQITFDEEKLREIVKRSVERFKEEYEIVDRPQGEWIGEADGYYNGELVYDTWYCSNCDYVVDDEEPPTWNFCPNCGVRMKGADDE